MKDLENKYGHRLPWNVSDNEIDDLVMRCTENAIKSQRSTRSIVARRNVFYWAASAAAAAVIVAVAFFSMQNNNTSYYDHIQSSQSLDQLLSDLNYDEVQGLSLGDDLTLAYLANNDNYDE